MPDISIELPEHIAKQLADPVCVPFPSTDPIEISLPTGGKIKGVADFTDKMPTDCSMSFSLLLQLGPLLANLDCFIKVLKLIEPLIAVMENITNPPKLPEPVGKFIEAATDVVGCITAFTTPAGLACFIIDILRLIVKLLKCIIGQIKTIISVVGGLALQISSAQAEGNTALLAALECAKDNAMNGAKGAMTAVEPITAILSMVSPLLGIAGVDPIEIPAIADPESLEAMEEIVTTLEELVATLELVADGLSSLC